MAKRKLDPEYAFQADQRSRGYHLSLTTCNRFQRMLERAVEAGMDRRQTEDALSVLMHFAYHDGEDAERAEH